MGTQKDSFDWRVNKRLGTEIWINGYIKRNGDIVFRVVCHICFFRGFKQLSDAVSYGEETAGKLNYNFLGLQ